LRLAEYALVGAEDDEEDAREDVEIRWGRVMRRSSFSPSPADKLPLSRITLVKREAGGWLGPSGIAERGDLVPLGLGGNSEELDEAADEEEKE